MNTSKTGIRHLAKICALKGIRHAIISPGSRNAPIITAFLNEPTIHCHSVVDERSAAFMALGIAIRTGQTTALICTSGSAVLNYSPAIAEAFYQKVPLLILSADRPNEWIDQGENQSIHQNKIFQNFIRKSFELPIETTDPKDLWYADRLINEAINACQFPDPAPVHLNIPLREPLYEVSLPAPEKNLKVIEFFNGNPEPDFSGILQALKAFRNKMLIIGSMPPDPELQTLLHKLNQDTSWIILSENIANTSLDPLSHIACIDRPIDVLSKALVHELIPDILITLGGSIVSKKLKFLFRNKVQIPHWHISTTADHWDTFQNLAAVIQSTPKRFIQAITENTMAANTAFQTKWLAFDQNLRHWQDQYFTNISFSDFIVFKEIWSQISSNSVVHLANSTPVRYANLVEIQSIKNIHFYSNRGVSGIDGSISTAVGAAVSDPEHQHICISGDLGFLYDSNSLWYKPFPTNLKIIVINNNGGNIFKIIPGPENMQNFKAFLETPHEAKLEMQAKTWNIPFYSCDNLSSLQSLLSIFLKDPKQSGILEVVTPGDYSSQVLKEYFNHNFTSYEKNLANH